MRRTKGFSLIELLIVIAVVGIISVVAVLSLNSAYKQARDAKRMSDVRQIQSVLNLFLNDNSVYPIMPEGVILGTTSTQVFSSQAGFSSASDAQGITYMTRVPADPKQNMHYVYVSQDGESYGIRFNLEKENESLGGIQCLATPGEITCQ